MKKEEIIDEIIKCVQDKNIYYHSNRVEVVKELLDQALLEQRKEIDKNIGMLRQWLNEDRIDDPLKMIDSEDIRHWLFINNKN